MATGVAACTAAACTAAACTAIMATGVASLWNSSLRKQCKDCYKAAILRRLPKGRLITCFCGCGEEMLDRDYRGRPRKFLQYHTWRVTT
jgi:hypothetical protein